jgi:hypothetical protein
MLDKEREIMERRTFLKIVGLGVALGVVQHSPLKLVEALYPSEYLVREIIGFHLYKEVYFVRYDVFNGKEQLHITFEINNINNIPNVDRDMAMNALIDEMRKRKWDFNDLKPMGIPRLSKGKNIDIGRYI